MCKFKYYIFQYLNKDSNKKRNGTNYFYIPYPKEPLSFKASQAINGKRKEPTQIFKWDRVWIIPIPFKRVQDKERLKRLRLNDLERSSPIGKR